MPNPNKGQVHVDSMLTNLSVAYMQGADAFVADKVFPVIPVQKQSDRYFVYDKGDLFRDEAKERAPGTESAGGEYDVDNTPNYYCKEFAFHKDVTANDRANTDNPLNADQDATDFVSQKMLLKRENVWAKQYFKTGVWSTEKTGVTTSPTSAQFTYWDKAAATPVSDISKAQTDIAELTGFRPNVLVLGSRSYAALKENGDIMERIKYTQRGVVTTDILAALFDVDRVIVANAVMNSGKKGAANSMSFVLGKHALLCYSAPKPGLKVPSAGYIFSWQGLLGAGAYGNRINRITMDWLGIGTERIEGEIAFDAKVIAADLGAFLNTTVSA